MDDPKAIEFAEPYLQMTCIDPAPATAAAVLAQFDRYYTEVHTPDVVRNNPGIRRAYRYELDVPDAKGGFGPKWLSIYEWEDRHGAQVFVVRGEAPGGSWRPDYLPEPPIWSAIGRGPQQWGRLMCNRLSESGPPLPAPAAIVLEGVSPPADAGADEAAAFRAFFASNHDLDAGNGISFSRATRYAFEHLGSKPPTETSQAQYLTIYEANADTARALRGGVVTPQRAGGPSVWERRATAWRHLYRRVSGCIYPGARHTAAML